MGHKGKHRQKGRHHAGNHARGGRCQGGAGQASAADQSCGDNDGDFGDTALKRNLASLGLALKDTTGDGNCLFRALADQVFGSDRDHRRLRLETVEYLRSREDYFKWFTEDGVTFERHCSLMEQDGTFGGNLELVAFARLYKLDISIYQDSGEVLIISGKEEAEDQKISPAPDVLVLTTMGTLSKKEKRRAMAKRSAAKAGEVGGTPPSDSTMPPNVVHIAYHMWEHYSSVRNADGPFDGLPRIKCRPLAPSSTRTASAEDNALTSNSAAETRILPKLTKKEESLLLATGTTDVARVRSLLQRFGGNADKVVEWIVDHGNGTVDGGNAETEAVQAVETATGEYSSEAPDAPSMTEDTSGQGGVDGLKPRTATQQAVNLASNDHFGRLSAAERKKLAKRKQGNRKIKRTEAGPPVKDEEEMTIALKKVYI